MLSQHEWECVKQRYDVIAQKLTATYLEGSERANLQKELSRLSSLLQLKSKLDLVTSEAQQLQVQATTETDTELRALFEEEQAELAQKKGYVERDLESLLYPTDPLDDRSVFLEIRAGTGGQEAALFGADLAKMYTNYAFKHNWHVSVTSSSETDLKGIREVVLHIEGKNVYKHLKFESGVHRVQRVPATETAGRIHTSTATVAVLPEAQEVDVQINPSDLRIDVYRSGGAGGQHVNTTDSAVRITHIPTGVVVACQEERSQHKNKAKAMKVLQSRLLLAQREKNEAERSLQRKEQVGSGMRSEKVRTYNYPQNRVTDHQVEVTLKKLDMVMEGDLDEIIDALVARERQERISKPFMVCE